MAVLNYAAYPNTFHTYCDILKYYKVLCFMAIIRQTLSGAVFSFQNIRIHKTEIKIKGHLRKGHKKHSYVYFIEPDNRSDSKANNKNKIKNKTKKKKKIKKK